MARNRKFLIVQGTFAASLGRVFRSFGVDTRIMKNDLYFNYDAGTINPGEHGEVYVLADGTEVDQDFGIYERFLNLQHSKVDYITSGRLFHQIYLNERNGKYLGQTVSVEHITDEIKQNLREFASQCQVGIVELGATIGDIKGVYLLEACRQLISELGSENSTFILLSHIPYLPNVGELKTMGCQRSVNLLRSKGIKPDIIIARTAEHDALPEYQMGKLHLYCEVPEKAVFCFPDLDDYYQIPRRIRSTLMHNYIALKMKILLGRDDLDDWYKNYFDEPIDLKIAILGKYPHQDAYISIINQLNLFGVSSITYMASPENLTDYDAVIIPGGWGDRGVEDMLKAAQICREEKIPCLGICLGLQVMAIEYARNVLRMEGANSLELDENTPHPVVTLQEQQKELRGMGGTARLGDWTTIIEEGSKLSSIYNSSETVQRHRHRYEISPDYDFKDFKIVGRDKRTKLIEVMELKEHPFYMGVQFHPEFSENKNPIFKAFVKDTLQNRQNKRGNHGNIRLKSVFKHGTPETYLQNIDISDNELLKKIISLTPIEIEEYGISNEQQALLSEMLQLLETKKTKMCDIQNEIKSFEQKIREINLQPSRIYDGKALKGDEYVMIENHEKEIKERNQELRMLRDELQTELLNYDDKLGKLRSS